MLFAEHAPASPIAGTTALQAVHPMDSARAASPASIEPNINIRRMADDQPIVLEPRPANSRSLTHRIASYSDVHGECGNRTHRTDLARISRRLGHDSPSRTRCHHHGTHSARTLPALAQPVPPEADSRINRGCAAHRRASFAIRNPLFPIRSLSPFRILHFAFCILHFAFSDCIPTKNPRRPSGLRGFGDQALFRVNALPWRPLTRRTEHKAIDGRILSKRGGTRINRAADGT